MKLLSTIPNILATIILIGIPALAIEPPNKPLPTPPMDAPAAQPNEANAQPAAPAPKVAPAPEAAAPRPFLGVILEPVPEMLANHLNLKPNHGVMILETLEDGPAAKAGIEAHDILIEVAGKNVGSVEDVRAITADHAIGDQIDVVAIHDGKRENYQITLEAAPDRVPAPQAPQIGDAQPGFDNEPFLENLPEKHADMIREALRRNLQALENPQGLGFNDDLFNDKLQREMRQRMQDMQEQMQNMGNLQLEMNGNIESSVRLLDNHGSIEMKSRNGHREVKVFDKAGNLIWEGPYDTEQDKAAVPDDIRKRIERLNFNIEDNGIKLRFQRGQFRQLEELDE